MKEYKLNINGHDYAVNIDTQDDSSAKVIVNGTAYFVEFEDSSSKKSVASKPQVAAVPTSHAVPNMATPATAKSSKPAAVASKENVITSPLPGVILDLKVTVGMSVSAGQTVVVLEAMKMENNIDSPFSGVVKSIQVNKGDSVLEGDALITIE